MPGPFPLQPQPDPEDNWKESETADATHNAEYLDMMGEEDSESELLPPQPNSEEQATVSPQASLPLEAQGETNGGPLGCCLGVTVGMMLFLYIGVIALGSITANILSFVIHVDAVTIVRITTGIYVAIGAIIGGYLGWKIGKRLYREYERPIVKERARSRKTTPEEANFL